MRVIETFVKFVPREKIPADAKWFVQGPITGSLLSIEGAEAPVRVGTGWSGFGKVYHHSSQQLATDAAETVVTREELMRAYDLAEQGYTLWFGGDAVPGADVCVDYVCDTGFVGKNIAAKMISWAPGKIIAYRLSRSVDKDVAAVNRVTNARDSAALKTRLELLDKMTGGVWPGADDEKFLVTADGKQLFSFEPEKLITHAQWDDYVSRKIRVGDKAETYGGKTVDVLFIGDVKAFVRHATGNEFSIPLNRLTRISQ